MNKYKILIADDHQVVINGLVNMLSGEESIEISKCVLTVEDVFSTLRFQAIDILILDVNMNEVNTFKVVPLIKKEFPDLKIITFTSYNTPGLWKEAATLGIDAFLTKDADKQRLIATIAKVASNQVEDLEVENNLLDSNVKDKFIIEDVLTEREIEILKLVAQGNTSQQIAELLFISKHTVQWHRKNIISKLNLNSARDMVKFAFEMGLV